MNPDIDWPNKAIHIKRLADEVADLKAVVLDISRQIRRIENRVNFAMTNSKPNQPNTTNNTTTPPPTLSEAQAEKTIEQLVEKIHQKQPIQPELRSMTIKHGLFPIARQLGLTNTKLPPKDELILTITTRLRQSAMLTEGIRRLADAEEAARKSHAKTPHRG